MKGTIYIAIIYIAMAKKENCFKLRKTSRSIICLCLISVMAIASGLQGCGRDRAEDILGDADQELRSTLYAVLDIPRSGENYPEQIDDYIVGRIKSAGLAVSKDKSGNVKAELPAAPGHEGDPLVILHCWTGMEPSVAGNTVFDEDTDGITPAYDAKTGLIRGKGVSMGAGSALGVSTLLHVIEKRGNTGPARVIFSAGTGEDMGSLGKLNSKWLSGCSIFINVDAGQTGDIYTGSAAAALMGCDQTLTTAAVENKRAYVLAATGFPSRESNFNGSLRELNPLKALTDILTDAAGAGVVYELCSLTSIGKQFHMPEEATAVLVVGEYEQRRFRTIFDGISSNLTNDIKKSAPDAKIEMIETALPETAVSKTDTSRVITYLSGIMDAGFARGSATGAAINVDDVEIRPDKFHCDISILGRDRLSARKLMRDQAAIAGLSNLTVNEIAAYPGYDSSSENETYSKLSGIYEKLLGKKPAWVMMPYASPLGGLADAHPGMNVISLGITAHNEGSPNEGLDIKELSMPAEAITALLSETPTAN